MKLYIIVRKELEMPSAKMAVQVGHAVEGVIRVISWNFMTGSSNDPLVIETKRRWDLYNKGCCTKIILGTDSKEQFDKVVLDLNTYALTSSQIPTHLVEDQGFNFFTEPTLTAFAIGPITTNELGKHKRLRLYQEK
jgi:peptidyl-tRNA hydrolase